MMPNIHVTIRTTNARLDIWMHFLQALRSLVESALGEYIKLEVREEQ